MKTLFILSLLSFVTFRLEASVGGQDLFSDKKLEVTSGKLGTVVIFLSAKCPCSNSHLGIVKNLAAEFKEYNFVAVHANSDETADQARGYFKNADLGIPVIEDSRSILANEYKANRTPDAFLIAANGKILFAGGVTNSHEGGSAEKQYLRDALLDARAGREVKVAKARTLGCAISRGSHGS